MPPLWAGRLAIQGMSFSKLALVAGIIEMLVRALCGLICVPKYGFIAACIAPPAAWLLVDPFLIVAFIVCFRKRRAEYAAKGLLKD